MMLCMPVSGSTIRVSDLLQDRHTVASRIRAQPTRRPGAHLVVYDR